MPKVCCIINCHNSDCDQRNVFGVPKNEERRRGWLDAISPYLREGRKIRKQLYVCSSHFKDDHILRNTTIRLKDGSVETIAHSRIKLKPSSIPCIFNAKDTVLPNIDLPAAENETSNTLTSEGEGQIELAREENRGSEMTNPEGEKKTRLLADGETAYNLEMLEKELTIPWEKANNHVWASCITPCGRLFSFFGEDPKVATKTVLVKEDMSTEIRAAGRIIMTNFQGKIKSVDDVLCVMAEVQKNHLCQGIDDSTPCPYDYSESSTTTSSGRCSSCRIQRKKKKGHLWRQRKRSRLQATRTRLLIKKLRQRNQRLVKNIASAKEGIADLQARCAAASIEGIKEGIKKFPSAQQEAVKACLPAAQCKGPTGMRYSQPWILECILLRIKSRRAYLHVLTHKILQVPTIDTLNKYLKKMKPSYGFNTETFDLLRAKAAEMKPEDRRGTLVLDEMKLSEAVSFDRDTLLFKGFTDLGKYTPEHQKKERGDHALVFMYQPFRGKWVQTVGAFLSKGCANSTILLHLILECIILLENANFFVDVVTTDGAPWNRTMWKHFGLEGLETSCEHPCRDEDSNTDPTDLSKTERLHFCSDFSHLLKLQNFHLGSRRDMDSGRCNKESALQSNY